MLANKIILESDEEEEDDINDEFTFLSYCVLYN